MRRDRHDLGPVGAGLLAEPLDVEQVLAELLGGHEVGLGRDRDLGGALDLGHLVDDEPVAGAELLVGREADRDHVDLGQRGLHQVVEPLAEQGARAVQAGGVDQDQLGVRRGARCRGRRCGWSAACRR